MTERRQAQVVEHELDVEAVLARALADSRKAISSGTARSNGGEVELIDELLDALPAEDLSAWLTGPGGEQPDVLGDVLGLVARRLAPTGDAPGVGAAAEAWQTLTAALDRLFGSGVRALGRLPFVSDELLELLRIEARRQRPEQSEGTRAAPGQPGRVLASFAVSPKLREAVAAAFGAAVVPTYDAVYQYDPPGAHVATHVDTRDYELVLHLVLEHALPADGSGGSALVAHLPAEPEPRRLPVEPGEAVVLRGRGTIHSWERLREDEHRTMVAIGFASAR